MGAGLNMHTDDEKMTLTKYILYSVPFLFGIVICVFLSLRVYRGFISMDDSFVRVVMPGTAKILLVKPGNYTIFHEHKSVVGNEIYSSQTDAVSGIRCDLKNEESGEMVTLKPSLSNSTYSLGSREGRSVFDFTVTNGGAFEFKCAFPEGAQQGFKTVFAFNQGFTAELLTLIFMIFGIIGIFIVSGCVTAALIIIKLHNISEKTGKQPVVE